MVIKYSIKYNNKVWLHHLNPQVLAPSAGRLVWKLVFLLYLQPRTNHFQPLCHGSPMCCEWSTRVPQEIGKGNLLAEPMENVSLHPTHSALAERCALSIDKNLMCALTILVCCQCAMIWKRLNITALRNLKESQSAT